MCSVYYVCTWLTNLRSTLTLKGKTKSCCLACQLFQTILWPQGVNNLGIAGYRTHFNSLQCNYPILSCLWGLSLVIVITSLIKCYLLERKYSKTYSFLTSIAISRSNSCEPWSEVVFGVTALKVTHLLYLGSLALTWCPSDHRT